MLNVSEVVKQKEQLHVRETPDVQEITIQAHRRRTLVFMDDNNV